MSTMQVHAEPSPAVLALLESGRRRLAEQRAEEARRKAARERLEEASSDLAFVPLMEAAQLLLPGCWMHYLRPDRNDFKHGQTNHEMRVELPGLAPIVIGFGVREWQDCAAGIGRWELGTNPFRIATYYLWSGEEGYEVGVCAGRDWLQTADPAEAMALAEESWRKRAEIAGEAEEKNRARAERAEKRALEKAANPAGVEERLARELKSFIRREIDEASCRE